MTVDRLICLGIGGLSHSCSKVAHSCGCFINWFYYLEFEMSKVGQFMSTQIYSTSPDKFAFEAVDEMYRNKVSALLVKEGEEYVGIITKTDWMFLVLKGECDPKIMKISSVMTKLANTIDENQTISEVCTIIETKKIRHVPVTRNGEIVGMFSVKDLEKYYLQLHKKTDF